MVYCFRSVYRDRNKFIGNGIFDILCMQLGQFRKFKFKKSFFFAQIKGEARKV